MEKLNIIETLKYFLKKSWLIIAIALLIIGIGYAYYYTKIEEKYEANSKVLVILKKETSTINTNSVITTIMELGKSKNVLSQVIDELKLETNYQTLANKVYINHTDNSRLINIKVSSGSAEDCVVIVNSITEKLQQSVNDLMGELCNVEVIDEATDIITKRNNIAIKDILNLVIVGFIVGITIVFVIYYFDGTIKDEEILKMNFNIPIIGKIHKKANRLEEDITILRTNIKHSDKNPKTILLTSDMNKVEKEKIANKLAESFTKNNEKVVLIDWNEKNDIQNSESIEKNVKETDIKNLYTLNQKEIKNEVDINKLILKLEKEYDHIIIVGGPIISNSNSLILSTTVDSVIVVVKKGYTKLNNLQEVVKSLENIKANILGIVVNNV